MFESFGRSFWCRSWKHKRKMELRQWQRWIWLTECESQQFLSFLRLLYSLYFSDRTDDEETRERQRFLNLWPFTPLPAFLTSFLPSYLTSFPPSFLPTHRYLLTNKGDHMCFLLAAIVEMYGSPLVPGTETRHWRNDKNITTHCKSKNNVTLSQNLDFPRRQNFLSFVKVAQHLVFIRIWTKWRRDEKSLKSF